MSTDFAPLEELPDLPEFPDLTAAGLAPAALPRLRVLDRAPLYLRLAALIVVAGSLLPWMPGQVNDTGASAWLTLLAKLVMGVAAWLWFQQVRHSFGPRLAGVLGQLASLALKPQAKPAAEGAKPRRAMGASAQFEQPFPTALHALALVLAAAAVILAWNDPRKGLLGSNGPAEVAMLGWAAFTWVHIASYERWGGFNPLFPLMFLAMLFSGAMAAIGSLGGHASGFTQLSGVLGGALVAAGGGLAAFTIVEAMVQAKKDGDRKKAEARKSARQKKG
jgi:hypothetical protein